MQLATLTDETRLALANIGDRALGIVTPTVRLGVTGLARAGKTVFITALVHNMIHGGRLPLFRSYASGRVSGAMLQPQPDDDVPRFDYERHVKTLVEDRLWPESTRQISELRLTIRYESASFLSRTLGSGKLNLDIVDYPGEWLLDLPLLHKSYADWSRDALAKAGLPGRRAHAAAWLARLAAVSPAAKEDESLARELAAQFTAYLRSSRTSDG
jgi:predicted YcjX-like family ATPase